MLSEWSTRAGPQHDHEGAAWLAPVKPIGETIAKLAEEMRRSPPERLKRPIALMIPDEFPSRGELPGWNIAKQFMDMIAQNQHPTVILESRAKDDRYLQSRGIEDLIRARDRV